MIPQLQYQGARDSHGNARSDAEPSHVPYASGSQVTRLEPRSEAVAPLARYTLNIPGGGDWA